jgi:hypothetical protein
MYFINWLKPWRRMSMRFEALQVRMTLQGQSAS